MKDKKQAMSDAERLLDEKSALEERLKFFHECLRAAGVDEDAIAAALRAIAHTSTEAIVGLFSNDSTANNNETSRRKDKP